MKIWHCLLMIAAVPVRAQVLHVPDAGAQERFSSFEVPAAGPPFQAVVVTAWKYRSTTHWNKHTIYSRRTVARDNTGRIFQERRMFSPDGDHKPTTVSELDLYDPASGSVLVYDPRIQQCRTQAYLPINTPQPLPLQQTVNGILVQRENLGTTKMLGVEAFGSRETLSRSGENRPDSVTEFWYSPKLAINLLLKRTNANGEMQTFTVQNLDLREPDRALFQPPAACNGKR